MFSITEPAAVCPQYAVVSIKQTLRSKSFAAWCRHAVRSFYGYLSTNKNRLQSTKVFYQLGTN